jgi:crotonobetainyl-CoA:carnitine CoA-transferase CaiB-like acyl-CoA transferase
VSDLYRARDGEAGPLAGVSVVDLTIARAGPTCVRQLADMGADVIQVANPSKGMLPGSDGHNLHRNKRSIAIDLKVEAGRDVFYRLADRADVVVENFRADVKKRLRIDYETLRERNPRLIYASISGFGQEGPYAARPGLYQIAQGMGGLMSVTGPPGSGPWRAGIAISDTASGTFLAQGVLAALYARERTGRGQWVHTSLLEAMVNFMDFQAMRWLIDGEVPPQAGNDHPTIFPMGTFRTQDGAVNLAAMMGWDRFLEAIDGAELDDDPRFCNWTLRNQNRAELQEAIEAKLAARTSAEWVVILNEVGIPCGPILAMDEVFADPQVQHLKLTRTVHHAQDGDVELLRLPINFSDTPAGVRSAAPLPAAHGVEILRELGFDDAAIADLSACGAITSGTGKGFGAP